MARRCTLVLLVAFAAKEAFAQSLAEQLAAIKEENAQLRSELALLRGNSTTIASSAFRLGNSTNSTAMSPMSIAQRREEAAAMVGVFLVMLMCWSIPLGRPCKRICETRLHKVFPLITIFNFGLLCLAVSQLDSIRFNDLFFIAVRITELIISEVQQVLTAIAAVFVLVVLWKFKDRILETLGLENFAVVFGDFRDWATCWSMSRFRAIEIFIWKVEGLPSANLHKFNDVFVEVSLGYNMALRTRVHDSAGHSCIIKESVQLNFDPYDFESKLCLTVKHQNVVGSSELSKLHLGASQVTRLEEPLDESLAANRTLGSADSSVWAPSRFKCLDLVPAGRIYLRFTGVRGDEAEFGDCWCCCPKRNSQGTLLLGV